MRKLMSDVYYLFALNKGMSFCTRPMWFTVTLFVFQVTLWTQFLPLLLLSFFSHALLIPPFYLPFSFFVYLLTNPPLLTLHSCTQGLRLPLKFLGVLTVMLIILYQVHASIGCYCFLPAVLPCMWSKIVTDCGKSFMTCFCWPTVEFPVLYTHC